MRGRNRRWEGQERTGGAAGLPGCEPLLGPEGGYLPPGSRRREPWQVLSSEGDRWSPEEQRLHQLLTEGFPDKSCLSTNNLLWKDSPQTRETGGMAKGCGIL